MANKYLLKPVLNTIKEGFYLEDENNNIVYEGKMLKFSLFKAAPFEFINHITNKREEHKIGKTSTTEESGLAGFFSTTSTFKYDNEKIWDYLHNKGIRINSTVSSDKLGMTYEISFEGKNLATIATSSYNGKAVITSDYYYDVICEEKDLDLVFLVAFSIAKTKQTFYN